MRHLQTATYAEAVYEGFAPCAHGGGDAREVALFPQCFVWIHGLQHDGSPCSRNERELSHSGRPSRVPRTGDREGHRSGPDGPCAGYRAIISMGVTVPQLDEEHRHIAAQPAYLTRAKASGDDDCREACRHCMGWLVAWR